MRTAAVLIVAVVMSVALLPAQETKPVPKDSVRVSIPGCVKGYVFTAGPRTADQPGSSEIPEGMHLRMNGPKKLMNEIKNHQGSMIEITGLMKKGQFKEGIGIGGGVRIMPGSSPAAGMGPSPTAGQAQIDVEGWRAVAGFCRTQ
jgi:hypothetical protein